MNELSLHPPGAAPKPPESDCRALVPAEGPVVVDTFGGRVHVEWDPSAAVTPLGQLAFFTEFLKVSGLFDAWVEACPLSWRSHNAPNKRDVLGTAVLAILSGHWRYAHISALRGDHVNAELLGMEKVASEDSVRATFARMDEPTALAWLRTHLLVVTEPLLGEPWILDADVTVKPEILSIAGLYRDRADCENNFDEPKNHSGRGGFTTTDLKRCQIMASMTALVYDWWSIFVRHGRQLQPPEPLPAPP